jgi:hypothetical protein
VWKLNDLELLRTLLARIIYCQNKIFSKLYELGSFYIKLMLKLHVSSGFENRKLSKLHDSYSFNKVFSFANEVFAALHGS